MGAVIHHGDCLEVMAGMEAGSVDAVVTDPPYGLSFMGKHWDHGVPGVPFWTEARRLLPPSGYLLAFGGTRSSHRLACALEDAGFEIRDTLMWLYGSGFPKGKSCLKPAWEPIILARKPGPMRELGIEECRVGMEQTVTRRNGDSGGNGAFGRDERVFERENPPGRWPANLILECTCAETREGAMRTNSQESVRNGVGVLKHGGENARPQHSDTGGETIRRGYGDNGKEPVRIHTDPNCPCAMLDGQTGNLGVSAGTQRTTSASWLGTRGKLEDKPIGMGDSGGASRFFYCPKASRSERDSGLWELPEREAMRYSEKGQGPLAQQTPSKPVRQSNHHPTVKPVDLMRWLVRLVARPGDTVLDPFCGSGTTGVACAEEGREFIGIEREGEYVEIARRRIDAASAQQRLEVFA